MSIGLVTKFPPAKSSILIISLTERPAGVAARSMNTTRFTASLIVPATVVSERLRASAAS